MASSVLESSEEKTNGFKLMRLIVDGGTEALRNIFLKIHPGNLQHVLATHYPTLLPLFRIKKIITQSQWDKLYPHPPGIPDIQEFDISILVVLLRNICSLSAPSTGWNAMPSATDKSREADIVRIRFFRNNFFGHIPGTAVSRLDFEARWVEVSSALARLGVSKVEIDRLKAEECGEEEVNRVREKWNESESKTVVKLDEIKLKLDKLDKLDTKLDKLDKLDTKLHKLDKLEEMLKNVHTLSHETSENVKSFSDNILGESLDWYDFENEIKLLLKRYTKGTREWVFEQVSTWLNDKSSPNRAFIISGQAGMGKSIIAAVICKLFLENFAACHFFQYNNSRYNNSKFLLQSLAWQLSNVFSDYKKELTAKLSGVKNQALNDMNIEGLFSMLLTEPLSRCNSDQCKPFLIVIDALDESRREDRYELVDLITKHFPKLPSYIRFLITTRSEKDIFSKFQALNPILLQPDEKRNLNDLRVFLENKLTTKPNALVQNLVARSEGLMLYASLIAENFIISDNESLPEGIEDIYESYFKRLETELRILGIREDKFSSLLSVVAVAKKPLPLPLIEKLLCPEKDSLSARRMLLKLISCVSSLFVVKDDCISIFHKSVRDWLVKPDHYFTVIETYGHKTLADICDDQMQTLKQNEVRSKFDPATDYALRCGIPHILEAEIKDKHALEKLIDNVVDLEIVHSSVRNEYDTTLRNFDSLTSWNMYNSLSEGTGSSIRMILRIIRKFVYDLRDVPQSFLPYVVNEKIEELSAKASALLVTRYKELAYFESDDLEATALTGRILTEDEVVEVDISPSEDFVICGYKNKGIELFGLSDLKPRWKIHDFVVERGIFDPVFVYSIVPRRIVFHPFLNIIFPGQLDPVLNLEGIYKSRPFICEKCPTKFTCCCFSHDHTKMVTHYDKQLIVWNLRDNNKVVTLPCDSTVFSMMFSGNDRYLATTDKFSFKVYDTENSYSMVSKLLGRDKYEFLLSTFKLDSWYWAPLLEGSQSHIVTKDLTNQPVDMNFFFSPRNERAMAELQAIMENKTPMWFHKLGSRGNFFIFGNGRTLFFKQGGYELGIFKINELIKGCKLKQEYDNKCKLKVSLGCKKNTVISVDGRYIYCNNPYIAPRRTIVSSTRPGKSWEIVETGYTHVIPVTNGVFCMKMVIDRVMSDGGTPELWNGDLTRRLFNFPELTGTFHCLSVAENLVACIMASEVRFFDVALKKTIACTQLPEYHSRNPARNKHNVIACGSQYHVVYTESENTLLLQKTNVVNLSERVLMNLKASRNFLQKAYFSPSGALLAFPAEHSIHILDISTCEILRKISLWHVRVHSLEFFDEEHLICGHEFLDQIWMSLYNVKTCDIVTLTRVSQRLKLGLVLIYRGLSFSVCRKTGDIVVYTNRDKALKVFKLWLPHQRKNENELRESCLPTDAQND